MTPDQLIMMGMLQGQVPAQKPAPTYGMVMLTNGQTMTGNWVFYKNAKVADFIDNNGTQWYIDAASIAAFSPQPEPAPP